MFCMRLCKQLGKTLKELLSSIDSQELSPRRENKKNDIKTFLDNIVKKQGEKSQLLD